MRRASRDPQPLSRIATLDQESIDLIVSAMPPVSPTLTPEQIAAIASQVDLSGKVDKVTGSALVPTTEISKIHSLGADNQDLSDLVVKETGKSLVTNQLIADIHAAGSDNQDLSGLQPKETGKGLSTNDYTTVDKDKLTAVPVIKVSATEPQNPQVNDIWIDIS